MSTASADPRWMGVGASTSPDAADAVLDAVTQATRGRPATLVMVFAAPSYDVAAVAAATLPLHEAGATVVGCTTAGEIAAPLAGSGHLVAVALGGPGFEAHARVGSMADGPHAAGEAAAQGIAELSRPHRVLLMLSDGLAGGRAGVVRGAYGVAGASVPLVGGCAGDELAMQQTFQILDGKALTGAVVGVALGSDAPIGIGVGHGWRRTGSPVVVTESDGHRIHTLDDEPALDVYLRAAGAPVAAFTDESTWQHITLFHPFGLTRPGGEEVRAVLGADYGDRSLFCGDVPQGTVISVMEGDPGSVLDGTRLAAGRALAALDGASPLGLVAFDCAARRAVLGPEGIATEVSLLGEIAGGAPVGGFYTYGEVARTVGSRGVHNATLVVLALA